MDNKRRNYHGECSRNRRKTGVQSHDNQNGRRPLQRLRERGSGVLPTPSGSGKFGAMLSNPIIFLPAMLEDHEQTEPHAQEEKSHVLHLVHRPTPTPKSEGARGFSNQRPGEW